jgi:hypothetical protein
MERDGDITPGAEQGDENPNDYRCNFPHKIRLFPFFNGSVDEAREVVSRQFPGVGGKARRLDFWRFFLY